MPINWLLCSNASPIAIQMNNQSSPKIVLLIIDSLMDEPLKKAIEENAPALEFFYKTWSLS